MKKYSIACDRCRKEMYTSPMSKSWHRGTYLYCQTLILCVDCNKKFDDELDQKWKKSSFWQKLWKANFLWYPFVVVSLGGIIFLLLN